MLTDKIPMVHLSYNRPTQKLIKKAINPKTQANRSGNNNSILSSIILSMKLYSSLKMFDIYSLILGLQKQYKTHIDVQG